MKMILGLGNPGTAYSHTLHNVGFMAIDRLAQAWNLSFSQETRGLSRLWKKSQSLAVAAQGEYQGTSVLLLKPQTYMNRSGDALVEWMGLLKNEEQKLGIENFLVLCDDVHLPLGKLRFKPEGSCGGHKGLKSIEGVLGLVYPRLRIGVYDPVCFQNRILKEVVLDRFLPEQDPLLQNVLKTVLQAVELWIESGMISAMNQFNGSLISSPPSKADSLPPP
jgi:PTH1 family peptidyl-tRNA hydrolase